MFFFFFFSSRRRHTRFDCDWSSDVCSSDLFALVAFERNCQETNPDCNDESKNDCRQSPPCKLDELSVDVCLTQHESSYFDEKWLVATAGGARNFGSATD